MDEENRKSLAEVNEKGFRLVVARPLVAMPTAKRKLIKRSYSVCFSPDGRLLASCGRDVVLWSSPEIKKLWKVHPLSHPSFLVFSPDSSLLAVKSTIGRIVLLSTETGEIRSNSHNEADHHGSPILFTDDGQRIVNGSSNGSHIVHGLDGQVVFREEFFPDQVLGVFRHPNGRWWFDHWRRSYLPPDGVASRRLIGRDEPFLAGQFQEVVVPFDEYPITAFSPDGRSLLILTGFEPSRLCLFSFPVMQKLRSINLPSALESPKCVRFSPCGAWVAVVGSKMLVLLSAEDLSIQHQREIPYGCDAAFSPCGRLLVIGSWSSGEVFATDEFPFTAKV